MARRFPLYANRATSTTVASINDAGTTITLAEGDGAAFPSPGAGQYVPAVLLTRSTGDYEEINITARSGDVLTVERAQGGTTAKAWASGTELFIDVPARELHDAQGHVARSFPTMAAAVAHDDWTTVDGRYVLIAGPQGGLFTVDAAASGTADGAFRIDVNGGAQQIVRVDARRLPSNRSSHPVISAIHKLLIDAASGENQNVKWIVTGDSTRENTYSRLLDYYYPHIFGQINVAVVDNAKSGLSAADWESDSTTPNLTGLISATPGDGEDCILEFSLGLNDYSTSGDEIAAKATILAGLNTYMAAKPQASILLVEPIATGNSSRNAALKSMYAEIADELGLPLCTAAHDAIRDVRDPVGNGGAGVFSNDNTHPTSFGSMRLLHAIIADVFPRTLLRSIVLDDDYRGGVVGPLPSQENLAGAVESGYWSTSDGTAQAGASWLRLPELDVTPGWTIRILHQGNRSDVSFMTSGGTFVSNLTATAPSNGTDGKVVVVPATAAKARINVTSDATTYNALSPADVPVVTFEPAPPSIHEINAGLPNVFSVDADAAGPLRVATVVDAVIDGGIATTYDGVVLTANAASSSYVQGRFYLFRGQSNAEENGVYECVKSNQDDLIFKRPAWLRSPEQFARHQRVYLSGGGASYELDFDGAMDLAATAQSWNRVSLRAPWNGDATTPNVALGNSSGFILFFNGNAYVRAVSGNLMLQAQSDVNFRPAGVTRASVKTDGSIGLPGVSSLPTGTAGDIAYDTTTSKHYGHDGTTWNALY